MMAQNYPDVAKLKAEASRRRVALFGAGCSTYKIIDKADSILCLCCGLTSFNPNDVEHKYCGFCHEFHADWRDNIDSLMDELECPQ
jgi:ribosomal protein L37E